MMNPIRPILRVLPATLLLLAGLRPAIATESTRDSGVAQGSAIVASILRDPDSFYHIDFKKYPERRDVLPVGVFDSGTGGLTVLNAILNSDQFRNGSPSAGKDGRKDFLTERFIYLADQANMPYGNYDKEGKSDLLREHVVKDAQFLLSDKYYPSATALQAVKGKAPVKVIVIACNTATAYGKRNIEEFLEQAGVGIKTIGVIDAGVRGALATLDTNEDAVIGIMATAGTVASNGYVQAIDRLKDERGYTGKITVFSQGGTGIAEAIDRDTDYLVEGRSNPYPAYKGPALDSSNGIRKVLLDVYNFDFEEGKMLCDSVDLDSCSILQINDPVNYMRFHLVSLLEQIRLAQPGHQLKTIILGCTHYPYLTAEIQEILSELYACQDANGTYRYREFMAESINLIDPAENTARELYEHLHAANLLSSSGNLVESEFYISVPNADNPANVIDENGRFPYAYKYGRSVGDIQEYVKVVPFGDSNIDRQTYDRLSGQIPLVYFLIEQYRNRIRNWTP